MAKEPVDDLLTANADVGRPAKSMVGLVGQAERIGSDHF